MFGLRYKKPYREYEYSRFSEEEQTTCIVYERQYNPVLDVTGFAFISCLLCSMILSLFKIEYKSNTMLIIFIIFMFIRLLMITEKDRK